MERVLRTFDKFGDAEKADDEFYASLTPQERLDILLEIVNQELEISGEAAKGLERIYRVIELSED
jgi:hypothetical protein